MDNFDGYTTYKHPGNPVSVDAEKRDAYLRIREQEAKIKRLSEALQDVWSNDYISYRHNLKINHAEALRDAGVRS